MICRYGMSGRKETVRAAAVVALFALMLYVAYFLTVHISLADVRNVSPGFVQGQIDQAISRMPPGSGGEINLPLPEVANTGDTYKSPAIVIPGEMDAVPWILDNTNGSDKFVADIFGAELIMGMTTRVSTEGGDWANAPDPVGMMSETNEIYQTDDPARAYALAKALNATLVYLPHRMLNTGWWVTQDQVNATKFDDGRYFLEVYNTSSVTIYRVL